MAEGVEEKYWEKRNGVAPVKAEYILWDKLDSFNGDERSGQADSSDPNKRAKLSGAQKRSLAKQRSKDNKKGGMNKARKFDQFAGEAIKLCTNVAKGQECTLEKCRWSHDLKGYMESRLGNIQSSIPRADNGLEDCETAPVACPYFDKYGRCQYGFKCRFGASHISQVGEGQGFLGSGYILLEDNTKSLPNVHDPRLSEKNEYNVLNMTDVRQIRGQGRPVEERFPESKAYMDSIGEPMDTREHKGHEKKNNKRSRNEEDAQKKADEDRQKSGSVLGADTSDIPEVANATGVKSATEAVGAADVVSTAEPSGVSEIPPPAHISNKDILPDLAPIRACEKKRLDFKGKLYMAPLTTVGNLPFRRLCGELGNDISCSEMGLSQEFMNGNMSEWSLVRRHPSEKTFGVQICGSRAQTLVPAAEMLAKSCDFDFLDINCGCPIDLVFNKGAGSALMQHANRLGQAIVGMNKVLGDIPVTIKIRTGIVHGQPTAHKLAPRIQSEWGAGAVTIHGRSRQQRYKTKADYDYIAQCVTALRENALENDMEPIPIFGNGDAYDYRSYYENVERSGVDGIMIARGALMKPWIFTEIKEKRDWDISARERLDLIGKLANYGLEHWGSDSQGVNTTRRFLCEALSFQYRYIPVGLLERLPAEMNERPLPYKGRNDLETLLASDRSDDWVKISEMFLGPCPESWVFTPKHKANSTETEG